MSAPDPDRDPYAAAGVNYAVLDPSKLLAQRTALATAAGLDLRGFREVPESRGESAYVIDLGDRYLATVTEALGTKNLVADAVRAYTGKSHYDAIAQDTAATILNDLATVGARPLCLTAYWGAGNSEWFADDARLADLVRGWGDACREARCAWGGGETQVLKTMIEPGRIVLGGNALGLVKERNELLLGSRVRSGDAILIAPAVGIHTNGLTLARDTVGKLARGFETPLTADPAGRSIGEALLDPTPLYGVLLEALLDAKVDLHYAVHVTGHGFRKLMRAAQPLSYVIDRLPEVPPVLAALSSAAGMSASEAYGTYNMGAGFAFYVPEAAAPRALAAASGVGAALYLAGHVESGPKRVVLRSLALEYSAESLTIR